MHKIVQVSTGRVFLVGDIHGCFDQLEILLGHVSFSPQNGDILVATGDLIDRGKYNLEVLRLLDEPWFFTVRGNHEQMAIEACKFKREIKFWLNHGGSWASSIFDNPSETIAKEALERILEQVYKLPYAITLNSPEGILAHVVHAEVTAMLLPDSRDSDFKNMISTGGEALLWGRSLWADFHEKDVSNHRKLFNTIRCSRQHKRLPINGNMSTIYSGHTILKAPMKISCLMNIDTGAYVANVESEAKYGLTLHEHNGKTFKYMQGRVEEVQPIIFTNDQLIKGTYANSNNSGQ